MRINSINDVRLSQNFKYGIQYNTNKSSFVNTQDTVSFNGLQDKNTKCLFVFDIDGVINNYPYCFIDWVNSKFQKNFKTFKELQSIQIDEYNNYKELYRKSGVKQFQPINKDTVDTINKLYYAGEKIVLYTVRPVSKYKRIYYDTITWLKINKINYHAIFWSDYSKEDFRNLGLKIKFFVDDNIDNAILFSQEGFKTFLLNCEFNQTNKKYSFIRVNKVSEILELI